MRLRSLQVNHLTNPVGYALPYQTFSWKVDAVGKKQETCRLVVAEDSNFQNILLDSGHSETVKGVGYTAELKLKPCHKYYWKVQVKNTDQELAEETAWFETGKMAEAVNGEWIKAPFYEAPYMKKTFAVEEVEEATLYVIGRCVYEIYMNGRKVGQDYLDPGFNSYDLWEQVHTWKVTEYIKDGMNTLGFFMGDGWYRGHLGCGGTFTENYGKELMIMAELCIRTRDGRSIIISSDDSFVCCKSPVLESSIYDGELYDARKEGIDFSKNGHEVEEWIPVECCGREVICQSDRLRPPVRKKEIFHPEIIHSATNEIILDFKQNFAGWVEGEVNIPEGEKLQLEYGEILQNGSFYNGNMRGAKARYVYCSDGKARKFRPHFTFYGFRYVKVSGISDENLLKKMYAVALYSDMQETGTIYTSNALLNRLIQNIHWGQKSNFLDIPSDCPQRDERLGWTGDTQIFAATASYNMDTAAFYTKYMEDTRKEQGLLDGGIPFTVPWLKKMNKLGLLGNHSSCGWGDVATVLPWTVFCFYADYALLKKYYPLMKDWVRYIKKQDDDNGAKRLWQTGFHFADWLALDNYKDPDSPMGGTDHYYVATAWYAYSVQLTEKAAKTLGLKEDEAYYGKLFAEIKESFYKEYFTENGRCAIATQTAKVLAIAMNLVDDEVQKRLAAELEEQIRENHGKLETGFCGTPFLLTALTKWGYTETAYDLLLNEEIPGWLYEVKMGATTIWERWNSVMPDGTMNPKGMNSLNHYAYGAVMEWMYKDMCGLQVDEQYPGFRQAVFAPKPDNRLQEVSCKVDTAAGLYQTAWTYENNQITYYFEIPFDCKAKVCLPDEKEMILESGKYEWSRKVSHQ